MNLDEIDGGGRRGRRGRSEGREEEECLHPLEGVYTEKVVEENVQRLLVYSTYLGLTKGIKMEERRDGSLAKNILVLDTSAARLQHYQLLSAALFRQQSDASILF